MKEFFLKLKATVVVNIYARIILLFSNDKNKKFNAKFLTNNLTFNPTLYENSVVNHELNSKYRNILIEQKQRKQTKEETYIPYYSFLDDDYYNNLNLPKECLFPLKIQN